MKVNSTKIPRKHRSIKKEKKLSRTRVNLLSVFDSPIDKPPDSNKYAYRIIVLIY